MAIFNSNEIAAQTGTAKTMAHYSASNAGVGVAAFTFTIPASGFVQDDEILLGYVPKGGRVLSIGRVTWQALGASTAIRVGHKGYTQPNGTVVAADDDAFMASVATTSADGRNMDIASRFTPMGPILNKESRTPVYAKITGAAPTPGAIVSGVLAYTVGTT